MEATPPFRVDTTNCELEPIRFPGAVQPHGALLVMRPGCGTIEAASESCELFLGQSPQSLLDRTLGALTSPATSAAALAAAPQELPPLIPLLLDGRAFDARASTNDLGQVLLDVEPRSDTPPSPLDMLYRCRRGLAALGQARDVVTVAERAATLAREVTGFDRVMVYRFDEAWNGEVIAEARRAAAEPYLGLFFPASDIPRQARVRLIPDTDYVPSAVVAPGDSRSIDLGRSALRSVSPIHIEYLKNMGVRATLTGRLSVHGRLWGLVACHHLDEPRYCDQAKRDVFGWLCEDIAAIIAETTLAQHAQRTRLLTRRRRNLAQEIRQTDLRTLVRSGVTADILGVVEADGFAFLHGDAIHTVGDVPGNERIRTMQKRRRERKTPPELYSTHSLVADLGLDENGDGLAGALFVSVETAPATTMIWFRQERRRAIRWAGDPTRSHTVAPDGRISPRKSFAQFLEKVRGQSLAWSTDELDSAAELRGLIEIDSLREQAALHQTVLDSSPENICVLDADGRISSVNETWRQFAAANGAPVPAQRGIDLGYRDACLTAAVSLDAATAAEAWAGIESVLSRLSSFFTLEYTSNSSTEQRWFQLSTFPLREPADGAVVRHENITARKVAEASLAQYRGELERLVDTRTSALSIAKEAAETANRAKSTFLATVSHELRTPLNAIIGLTGLVLGSATDAVQRDRLAKISRASEDLDGKIREILDVSSLEANRLTLEATACTLGDVIARVVGLCGPAATDKHLPLVVDAPQELVTQAIIADAVRLEQVLITLVSNAIRFTERGSVVVRARATEPPTATSVHVRIEIQDTGIGISDADKKRAFGSFQQADGSLTRSHGGMGVGLAISARLIRLMGGSIGLHSEVGVGTTVWFAVGFQKAVPAAGSPDI